MLIALVNVLGIFEQSVFSDVPIQDFAAVCLLNNLVFSMNLANLPNLAKSLHKVPESELKMFLI